MSLSRYCCALIALGAFCAFGADAQVLGQGGGILGGDEGFLRAVSAGAVTPTPTVTIGAQPYTRTTTCTGSYTLTGTATDVTSVAWAASPSGESGACTGTASWSCVIAVSPDASGEGVETVTVTATGAGGTGDDTETIGFYVSGAHSCFLAQSVDGSYNSTLADNDAVATWENLGSSALDVTQGTGTAQPTFRTNIVDIQPTVRCDGSDMVAAATASDWSFLNDGTDWTVDTTAQWTAASSTGVFWATRSTTSTSSRGAGLEVIVSTTNARMTINNGTTSFPMNFSTASTTLAVDMFHNMFASLNDDGGGGADAQIVIDDGTPTDGTKGAASYDGSAPAFPFSICASGTIVRAVTGDIFRVLVYQRELSDTERAINVGVDEWAFSGTLPVVATAAADNLWLFVGDSITSGSGGVTSWVTKLYPSRPPSTSFLMRAASGATTSGILSQWTAARSLGPNKVFILGGINDIANGGVGAGATAYANLSTIYSQAIADGATVVASLTPPFGSSDKWTEARQDELESLASSISADGNVTTLVDFYTLLGDSGDPVVFDPLLRIDNVHPNEGGTTLMSSTMATALGL